MALEGGCIRGGILDISISILEAIMIVEEFIDPTYLAESEVEKLLTVAIVCKFKPRKSNPD